MFKISFVLLTLILVSACRVTETEYMFSKGSTNYAAAIAEIARRCKSENEKLVTNLEKTDNFEIFFSTGETEKIYKITREKKDNGTTTNVTQFIRLKKITSSSMDITFVSSGTDDQDQKYSFTYTSANNQAIRDEIIEGVCDPDTGSYSGNLENSSKSITFSDDRKKVDGTDSSKYEQTTEKSAFISSSLPAIFYKWSGSFKRITNLDGDADNIEKTLEYGAGEYGIITSLECNDSSDSSTGCPAVEDPQSACTLSITPNHYSSEDPEKFLVEFAGGGNCPTL
jgi:hypothetical protein